MTPALAGRPYTHRPSPLFNPLLTAGPVVVADDPCEAAFVCETPLGARKYYRARYYDPSVGRFLSEDPEGEPGAGSRFIYAANNPARLSDPLGLRPGDGFWTAEDAVIDTFQFIADNKYDYKWDAWEYGGEVCKAPNGCICCTQPITDRQLSWVEPRESPYKGGTTEVGWYHTHPPSSLPGISGPDKLRSSPKSNGGDGVPGYTLQTSDGKVLKYVWPEKNPKVIGLVAMPK